VQVIAGSGPSEGQPTLLTVRLARNLPLSLAGEATHRAADGTEATLMEAVKARLDARAPRLRVLIEQPEPVPREPSSMWGAEPQPLASNTTYRMPRDHERQLLLRTAGQIINDGPDIIIQVQLHPPLTLAEAPNADLRPRVQYAHTVLLLPGASASLRQRLDLGDLNRGEPPRTPAAGQVHQPGQASRGEPSSPLADRVEVNTHLRGGD